MFDCIIPIGQTCNITLLLQNAKLKKQTTLFEWFVSPSLNDITNILVKIAKNLDEDIITAKDNQVFIDNALNSIHYNYENFTEIYKRRKDRLINTIKSSKSALFCRFESDVIDYNTTDIDNFINAILHINPNLQNVKLLLICPEPKIDHPSLINVKYDKHRSDLYCEGPEINNLFITSLEKIGYDVKDVTDTIFTDVSEL